MAHRSSGSSAFVLASLLVACGPAEERLGSVSQADTTPVCARGETLDGIDVSHWQDTIDWDQVAASGISFAFIKATEHTSYVDPTLDDNWTGIQQNGLIGGAYHFFHADLDPIDQAEHFLANTQGLAGNLLPVLDMETADGESEATITARGVQWLEHVAAQTGKTPILYSSSAFLSDFSAFSPYILWVANWNVACPKVPDAWPTWTFWQHSDSGDVPGIDTPVDVNQFNGSLADLEALADPGSATTGTGGVGSGGAGGASTTTGTGADGDGGEASGTTSGASSGDTGTGSGGEEPPETLGAGAPESTGGCATAPRSAGGVEGMLSAVALLVAIWFSARPSASPHRSLRSQLIGKRWFTPERRKNRRRTPTRPARAC